MQKLEKLIKFLSTDIKVDDRDVIVVIDDNHATERLQGKAGMQVVVSYPQLEMEGDSSDHFRSTYTPTIFVLEPSLNAASTPQREQEQYLAILKRVNNIITTLRAATTDFENSKGLNGMQLLSLSLVPVYKLFGGWCGWMVELELK